MIKKSLLVLCATLGICGIFSYSAMAFTIEVDGKLDEWGVTPGNYLSSDWLPFSGINTVEEDNNPAVYYLGPGYGFQQFDVEAMYLTYDTSNLYYAIVTGFPSGGAGGYVAGDIGFDIGAEGEYDYGVSTLTRNGLTAGTLYKTQSWANGSWGWKDPLSNPTYITDIDDSFTPVTGELAYLQYKTGGVPYYSGNHYVIEGYFPYDSTETGDFDILRMHWTMSCGNDYLNLDAIPGPPSAVPEPATLSLLGIGLLGILTARAKRKI